MEGIGYLYILYLTRLMPLLNTLIVNIPTLKILKKKLK